MNRSRSRVPRALAGLVLAALVLCGAGSPGAAWAAGTSAAAKQSRFILQVNYQDGYRIKDVQKRFKLKTFEPLVSSRGIYLVTQQASTTQIGAARTLASAMEASDSVLFAEVVPPDIIVPNRFHSWLEGRPCSGWSAADFRGQPLARTVAQAQRASRGSGIIVAVLDTGVDRRHPALRGKLVSGYDYIDDDRTPDEVQEKIDSNRDGQRDSAYGHGTFVAGLVSLVAPDARIMPMRVLDSDGVGDGPVIAQAVLDAVRAGASIINLSLGTDQSGPSKALDQALQKARSAGVVVVGAAGNGRTATPLYPANASTVLSVAALDPATHQLARFSSYGSSVDVAASGVGVIGPLPGGRYAVWSGSSMAAPVVAGQAALIRSRMRALGPSQVITAITSTATPIGGPWIESGEVNVEASLRLALSGSLGK